MPWNWELPDWPNFQYDPERVSSLERQFLVGTGSSFAYLKTIEKEEYHHFIVEILSSEGMESSRIEGEILDRESLQSSIRQHFGLKENKLKKSPKESGMADLLCDVYETWKSPLTHQMLWKWHEMLFKNSSLDDIGTYRNHPEPMQIVSGRYGHSKVFFEAPPSSRVYQEMNTFIEWYNSPSQSLLAKAAIAHLYFESIHPFEDGNGRIGRALVEKILSQGVGRAVLIAVSKQLEREKKEYYAQLEKCNRKLDAQEWVEFFSHILLKAHQQAMNLLYFLVEKSKMLNRLSDQLNARQTKVLLRMFEEGPDGFKGGLSAENYISITQTTRATATRDLIDLVEKGALKKRGELRYTRYYLNTTDTTH